MKNKYFLSICIPTYNRKAYLKKTLSKILKTKGSNEVEIVIADDASDDGTEQMVSDFAKTNNNLKIKYIKFKKRIYFDRMVLSVVGAASGDYCWLISDDDTPLPHSLTKIKQVIQKNTGVSFIHLNYVRFDNILKKITSKRMIGDLFKDTYYNSSDEFFFKPITKSYFKFLGTNMITMSTDIFDRKKWLNSVTGLKKYIGYNFIHCFAITTLIKKHPSVYVIGRPSVVYLSNNHRVWPNDIWKDYNNIFLSYLGKIGYSKSGLEKMQKQQKRYEQREGFIKNPIFKIVYKLLRPVYVFYQFVSTKINE